MFTSILDSVLNESSVAPVTAWFNGVVASLGNLFPVLAIALCLFVGLFGRRFVDAIRFILLFAIGFVASVYWLAPLVHQYLPDIPALAVGIAVGLLAAVLSRMIYNFVYMGCIGFDTYNICFNALFIPSLTEMTKGNLALSIGIAAAAVLLALLVRKYLEMIITAAAGGVGIAYFAKGYFDFTTLVDFDPMVTLLAVGGAVGLLMFFYQYRNRVIY